MSADIALGGAEDAWAEMSRGGRLLLRPAHASATKQSRSADRSAGRKILAEQAGTALVLRTTRGKELKPGPGLVFVEPSEEPRIASWDYTNPAAIDSLYDLGRRDASDFMQHRAAGVHHAGRTVSANAGKPISC